jgi:hypothetical protein
LARFLHTAPKDEREVVGTVVTNFWKTSGFEMLEMTGIAAFQKDSS